MTTEELFYATRLAVRLSMEGFAADEALEELTEHEVPQETARQLLAAVEAARPIFMVDEGEEEDDDEGADAAERDLHAEVAGALKKARLPVELADVVLAAFVAVYHETAEGEHEASLRDADGVPVLVLRGDFNELGEESVEALRGLLAEARGRGASLLVDCAGLEFAQINVLSEVLVDLFERRAAGGDIRFFELSERMQTMFDEFHLRGHVTVAADEAAARAGLEAGGRPADLGAHVVVAAPRAGRVVLEVRGAMTAGRAEDLRRALEQALPDPGARAVLDLSRVPHLDAEAFSLLANVATRAGGDAASSLTLAGLWGMPRVMVEVLGLGGLFTVVEQVDDALR